MKTDITLQYIPGSALREMELYSLLGRAVIDVIDNQAPIKHLEDMAAQIKHILIKEGYIQNETQEV